MQAPRMVRNFLMAKIGKGITKLHTTMVQKRREGAADGGPEDIHLGSIIAVPGGDVLGEGEVDPQQAEGEQQLAEMIEMNGLQILLEMEELAEQGHGKDQPGDAAEDGSDDEVRAKDRGVPAGYGSHGEVPGNDGVHRDGHGNDGDGHDVHGASRRCHCLGVPCQPSEIRE